MFVVFVLRGFCSMWYFLSLRFWHFRLVALLVLIVSSFHLLSRVLLFVWSLPSPSSTRAEWALKKKGSFSFCSAILVSGCVLLSTLYVFLAFFLFALQFFLYFIVNFSGCFLHLHL